MSPEQRHCEPMTVRTDVFGFGATMYHLLTGQRLTTAFSDKVQEQMGPTPPPPAEIAQRLPPELMMLVMQCVRPEIQARPASMDAVLDRLIQIRRKLED
jgi:serine/threonine-protein kinase